MIKRLSALLAFLALALGMGLAVAGPAQAAPGCPTGAICFHDTATVNPNEWRDGVDTSYLECHPFPASTNNTTSYVTNNTGRTWYVFLNGNCTGSYAAGTLGKIYAHTAGAMNSTWNNTMSSYRSTVPGESLVASKSIFRS